MKFKTMPCSKCGGTGKVPDYDFGTQLRNERQQAGISLRQLSAEMGYSVAYVADLELGRRNLNNDLVDSYMTALERLKK